MHRPPDNPTKGQPRRRRKVIIVCLHLGGLALCLTATAIVIIRPEWLPSHHVGALPEFLSFALAFAVAAWFLCMALPVSGYDTTPPGGVSWRLLPICLWGIFGFLVGRAVAEFLNRVIGGMLGW